MNRRIFMYIAIMFMAIGFAALSTALYINGQIKVSVNENDFDVYFSKVYEDGVENNTLIVDKNHIQFSKELINIGEKYELEYIVTNGSKNYDAEISMTCSSGNEYLSVTNTFDDTTNLQAGNNREGTLITEVIKSPTEELSITVSCEINVDAVSRTELGAAPIEYTKGVYGVRRSRESSDTTWERIGDSVGLVANATKNGSAVQNDFDNIYPWSDIITYNYDDVTKQETAVIGDENFKFDGSNGQVLTRIPEFYYKREVKDGYEYIFISKDEQEGYTKSEAFSVGRYTMSSYKSKAYSRSGMSPIIRATIADFRTAARNLGEDFGQLDWRYFIIQLLYLVEYADYNSRNILGLGNTNGSSSVTSGGCNNLGMKSGTIVNDGKNSVTYRGIEDIFGNVWQFVDGINIKNHVVYINYNPTTYDSNGDYQPLSYVNAKVDAYITALGYDVNNPLISFPTTVGGDENSYMSNYYWQDNGNRVVIIGGGYHLGSFSNGMWSMAMNYDSSLISESCGARLLRYQ